MCAHFNCMSMCVSACILCVSVNSHTCQSLCVFLSLSLFLLSLSLSLFLSLSLSISLSLSLSLSQTHTNTHTPAGVNSCGVVCCCPPPAASRPPCCELSLWATGWGLWVWGIMGEGEGEGGGRANVTWASLGLVSG